MDAELRSAVELAEALKRAGLKLTPQRLAILECLAGDGTHPTAQELYERLRERFPTMSVATVYNTLGALSQIGGCRPLEMGGATRFDPNVGPHHHAVCERCGSIRDVAGDELTEPPCPLPGFRVHRVERVYRGVCANCGDAVS